MYEYNYITIYEKGRNFSDALQNYWHTIDAEAAQGWRYTGWFPAKITNGEVTQIDLIFEREV